MEEEDVTGSRLVMRWLKPVIGNINELHKYEELLQNKSTLQELECFDESKLVCLNFLDIPLQSLPEPVARLQSVTFNLFILVTNPCLLVFSMTSRNMRIGHAAMANHGQPSY